MMGNSMSILVFSRGSPGILSVSVFTCGISRHSCELFVGANSFALTGPFFQPNEFGPTMTNFIVTLNPP
jgi:hypothetical protein